METRTIKRVFVDLVDCGFLMIEAETVTPSRSGGRTSRAAGIRIV